MEFSVRSCPYFVSQYLWIVIIYVLLSFGIFYSPVQSVGLISSPPATKSWNSSENPRIFTHLTDVHLSTYDSIVVDRFSKAINISYGLGSEFIVLTGDIVDNWGETSKLSYGHQYEPDFRLYRKTLQENKPEGYELFDIPGNHDEYGVPSLSSSQHLFLKYSNSFDETFAKDQKKYWVSTKSINGISFVYFNPYIYPTPHAKLGFWPNPTQELLDLIEKEVNNTANNDNIVFVTHFPVHLWSNIFKSTSGKTFKDIVRSSSAKLILTGHLHPKDFVIQHHNGLLEIVGPDLLDHNRFGIVSIDNNRYAYHEVDPNIPLNAVVTHPVPTNQLSRNTCFSETNSEIRVLVFSNDLKEINFTGSYNGSLQRERMVSNGVWLYSFPVLFSIGKHHIEFVGDWNHSIDFFIGQSVSLPKEDIYGFPNFTTTAMVAFAIYFVLCFYLVIPVHSGAVNAAKWVSGRGNQHYWFTSCFLGFAMVKHRISSLPKWIQVFMIIIFVEPFLIPLTFFDIGGAFGGIWAWGYYSNSVFRYDIYSVIFCLVYYAVVVMPLILLASAFSISLPFRPIFILDILVFIFGLLLSCLSVLTLITEAAGLHYAMFSPGFVITPIVGMLILVIWRITKKYVDMNTPLLLNVFESK